MCERFWTGPRTLVSEVLVALGFGTVLQAANGEAAFRLIKDNAVDIALLDWNMEPVDGLELTRLIRRSEDSPDHFMPIIMLSGHSDRQHVLVARDAGVTEFMTKPVAVKSLCSRLNAVIEAPRPFIRAASYFGPDRRRRSIPITGPERRAPQAQATCQ
ncbi:MAG: response regulator [Alphaproteobacteria bacterium]|nr:response regulator [Alphaproteobacteria bacterium]